MKKDYTHLYALFGLLLLLVDRFTKYLVMYQMPYHQINSFVSIDLVFNRGMSFGLFHSDDAIVFMAVNIFIGCVIALLAVHTYARVVQGKIIVGEICIFTGAISNVIDRWLYSGVIDFIAISYGDWHFAVFNVADVLIFCGVVVMLLLEYQTLWKK